MAKKDEKQNRRRFEEQERKPWTEDERKKFLDTASKIAPYVRHLTTPAVKEKEKDPLEALFQ